jgi:hypothetical protein
MTTTPNDKQLAVEVARRKRATIGHQRHVLWVSMVSLAAAAAVGLGVWFSEPRADRDSLHLGLTLGLAGTIFCVGGLVGRFAFPKPSATCPQCGCDWNAESDNNPQTWLGWQRCPGCGLQMSDAPP